MIGIDLPEKYRMPTTAVINDEEWTCSLLVSMKNIGDPNSAVPYPNGALPNSKVNTYPLEVHLQHATGAADQQ